MVRFKEFKRRDKVYHFVVKNEETKVELDTTFIFYPSLLRPDIEKILVTPRSNFTSPLTTQIKHMMTSTSSIALVLTIAALSPLFCYLGENHLW